MYHDDGRINQSGRFRWPLFDNDFCIALVVAKTNYIIIFFTSFENEMSKISCNYI